MWDVPPDGLSAKTESVSALIGVHLPALMEAGGGGLDFLMKPFVSEKLCICFPLII